MLTRLVGSKVGMTQVFDKDRKVVPVTVIKISNWFVTQVKRQEKDGYSSLQLGKLKKRHHGKSFTQAWISKKREYFNCLREMKLDDPKDEGAFKVGQEIVLDDNIGLQEGDAVQVSGISRGLGFQGVVKRWDFAGGPKSHGSNFHRIPGSIGFMRRQGEVIRGTKMPGHCGNKKITVKGLRVVRIDKDSGCIFVKGAVPGKKDSLVYVSKQG